MKAQLLAATIAFAALPTLAVAQVTPPDPTNQAIDDAQRPDKHRGTTPASPPPTASDQPAPTTDPTGDSQRMGLGFQGQPHGRGGVPKTIPQN